MEQGTSTVAGGTNRTRSLVWSIWLCVGLPVLASSGCGGGGGDGAPRCGQVQPAMREVLVCGAGRLCICSTGECAVPQSSCATRYGLAADPRVCLSPSEANSLVPSTPEDHPLCGSAADADADVDADVEEGGEGDDEPDGPDGRDDTAVDDAAGEDGESTGTIEWVVFSEQEMRSGTPDRRRVSRDVGFPVPEPFEQIRLEYRVRTGCPTLCDPVARPTDVTMDLGDGRTMELLRAVTPYGGDATWVEDVTDLAPLFTYSHRVSLFIDTTEGAWVVDLKFVFVAGTPPREVVEAVPLYDENDVRATTSLPDRLVTVPAGVTGAALLYRLSGYGTAAGGCDETCERSAFVDVDGVQRLELVPWRNDCASFVSANPLGDPGTVGLDRSGWCPADRVRTGRSDVSAWVTEGDRTFNLSIADIDPTSGFWQASLVLVLYR